MPWASTKTEAADSQPHSHVNATPKSPSREPLAVCYRADNAKKKIDAVAKSHDKIPTLPLGFERPLGHLDFSATEIKIMTSMSQTVPQSSLISPPQSWPAVFLSA
jgi:hypothetical protein